MHALAVTYIVITNVFNVMNEFCFDKNNCDNKRNLDQGIPAHLFRFVTGITH